jgi:spoIIIJ-associated protein
MVEWVEVRGKTVELAIDLGLQELGLDGPEAAEIEVVQEPSRGFLGMGGQDAIVRIKARPKRRRRRRGRGRGGDAAVKPKKAESEAARAEKRGGRPRTGDRSKRETERPQRQARKPRESKKPTAPPPRGRRESEQRSASKEDRAREESKVTADINQQATVVEEFLSGLVEAFGFDGTVTVRVDDDVILASVEGAETEALVGDKGAVMQSILELTRTVVQRKTQEGARIRIDIAGYGERRREALQIYAKRLADKVLSEGGEIMLEPMNPAERKVVHDAIAEIDGVRTFSEGEDPNRSVVIGPD